MNSRSEKEQKKEEPYPSLGISYNLMSFPILQVRLHFCMTNIMLLSESAKYFRTLFII